MEIPNSRCSFCQNRKPVLRLRMVADKEVLDALGNFPNIEALERIRIDQERAVDFCVDCIAKLKESFEYALKQHKDTRTIKPCPFCGGLALLAEVEDSGMYRVWCTKGSHAMDKLYDTQEKAIEEWNKRV